MKIIAIEKEKESHAAMQPHLKAEAARAWELYVEGVIRELHFHAEKHTAVLVLECESAEAAQEYLNALPLVKEGMIEFEIIPLIPYSGFSRLFAGLS